MRSRRVWRLRTDAALSASHWAPWQGSSGPVRISLPLALQIEGQPPWLGPVSEHHQTFECGRSMQRVGTVRRNNYEETDLVVVRRRFTPCIKRSQCLIPYYWSCCEQQLICLGQSDPELAAADRPFPTTNLVSAKQEDIMIRYSRGGGAAGNSWGQTAEQFTWLLLLALEIRKITQG